MRPSNNYTKVVWQRVYRYTIIATIVWTILIWTFIIHLVFHELQENRELAKIEARSNFNKDLAFRSWATSHGGVYVPPSKRTPPNPYLKHVPDRDIKTTTGKSLTLMNPAYMLRQMMNEYSDLYGIKGRITSLKVLNPLNAPDEWEKKALLAFNKGINEVIEFAKINNKPYLRLMRPMVTKKACLKCHSFQGYKVGDIRGGIGVSVPLNHYIAMGDQSIRLFFFSYGSVWLLGLATIGFVTYISKHHLLERKKIENTLKESEENLRTILDTMTEGVALNEIVYDNNNEMIDYRIINVNKHFYDTADYKNINVIGSLATELYGMSSDLIKSFWENQKKDNKTLYTEMYSPFKNRCFFISTSPFVNNKFVTVFFDITERKEAEKKIQESLKEKEILLREIHHRVKNNMQTIISLIKLQSRQIKDEQAVNLLKECENRILSMDRIHAKLYQTNDLIINNFNDYVKDLINNLFTSYNIPKSKINYIINIHNISLGLNLAIPCGLIINELVTNCLKHAFPNDKKGEIKISLVVINDTFELTIGDNGIGIADSIDITNADTLGLSLVNGWVKQIKGKIDVNIVDGTQFFIQFK
ncbi:MAG: DUF3365 domain-containing protein [Spirochaetota bacterium]|nr:DUF3365 domain-containing protein [Spirochaetota bacterium]